MLSAMDLYSLTRRLSDLRMSPPLRTPPSSSSSLLLLEPPTSPLDPLTVQEVDLERRCLGILTDALRAVISYAHSSYHVPISFQVKRFDRAHGQVWVKTNPDDAPEGFDLKYLLQHIKFYENMPRYAKLLQVEDYHLKATCQYFLDLQSRASSPRLEDPASSEAQRVKETVSRTCKFLQEMIGVGLPDRDVSRQLLDAQAKLRELGYAVDKYCTFQQNHSEVAKLTSAWYPEEQQLAARHVHQQMQTLLDDPEVVKYVLHVVAPRLGLLPFQAY
ncbi:hypothetical protein EMCRGX_G034875 [Ephydatia muelleri]|eukprot:Em0023g769a